MGHFAGRRFYELLRERWPHVSAPWALINVVVFYLCHQLCRLRAATRKPATLIEGELSLWESYLIARASRERCITFMLARAAHASPPGAEELAGALCALHGALEALPAPHRQPHQVVLRRDGPALDPRAPLGGHLVLVLRSATAGQLVRLETAMSEDAVIEALDQAPVRELAGLSNEPVRTVVDPDNVVQRAPQEILASAWLGLRWSHDALVLSCDHLVLEGKACLDLLMALGRGTTTPEVGGALDEGSGDPFLPIALHDALSFDELALGLLQVLEAHHPSANPTLQIPCYSAGPEHVPKLYRRISAACLAYRERGGVSDTETLRARIVQARAMDGGSLYDYLWMSYYSAYMPAGLRRAAERLFWWLPGSRAIISSYDGAGLLTMIETTVDSEEAFHACPQALLSTMRAPPERLPEVVLGVHRIVWRDAQGRRLKQRYQGCLSASSSWAEADELERLAEALEHTLSHARG